eukprot:7819683-Pyramimonas_sp.AAC.1
MSNPQGGQDPCVILYPLRRTTSWGSSCPISFACLKPRKGDLIPSPASVHYSSRSGSTVTVLHHCAAVMQAEWAFRSDSHAVMQTEWAPPFSFTSSYTPQPYFTARVIFKSFVSNFLPALLQLPRGAAAGAGRVDVPQQPWRGALEGAAGGHGDGLLPPCANSAAALWQRPQEPYPRAAPQGGAGAGAGAKNNKQA